jgi:hypothetical protein
LLCIYCHENEHARIVDAQSGGSTQQPEPEHAKHKPLAGLGALLKRNKK